MENENYPIWKHSIIYGVYLGVALIIVALIFYILGFYGEQWTGYVSYVVMLAGVVFASITYRNKYLGGLITYGQSFSAGFLTGLFAAIITSIFSFVFITYLGEEYLATQLEIAEETILESRPDISDDELDMALNITKNMMKPWWLSMIVFLSSAFFSLIFALIASIFIKKEDNSLEVSE